MEINQLSGEQVIDKIRQDTDTITLAFSCGKDSIATSMLVPLMGDAMPDINSTIPGKALYAVFFNRLDYLLGRSTEWWDCETAEKKIKELGLNGVIDPLCSITVKDDKPE